MRNITLSLAAIASLATIISCGDSSKSPTAAKPSESANSRPGDPSNTLSSSSINAPAETFFSSSSISESSSAAIPHPASSSSSAAVAESSAVSSSSNSSTHHRISSSSISSSSSKLNSQISSSTKQSSTSISLDENGFATVADIYHNLRENEKVIFVIRHSEREDNVAIETELTANGIKMAQDLGATLKSDEEFSYITSGFVRTNETANNISKGRGEKTLPKLITNYDITGNWFLKISADSLAQYGTSLGMKGGSVELMAHWAYDGGYPNALYELSPRAEEFMQKVILKNLPKWKRVSIMVSHDIFVMPLTVFGSKGKVALKYHEDYHWINYIAGLAIIIDEQNNLRYIPVKGAESGVIDYLAIYMEEHGIKQPKTPGK
jgi:broad specificity phosphatase PhoE